MSLINTLKISCLLDDKDGSTTHDTYVEHKPATWLVGVAVAALIVALGGLAWSFGLQSHLTDAESKLSAATAQNASLS
jgi:hypothetical protein